MFQTISSVIHQENHLSKYVLDFLATELPRAKALADRTNEKFDEKSVREELIKVAMFNEQETKKRATEKPKHKDFHQAIRELSKSFEHTPENFLRKNKIDMQEPQVLANIAPCRGDMRAMPNDFARSSLFFVKKKGTPRKSMSREKLFHLSDKVEVLYTGEELRDDDELVWLSLVHYCYDKPLGDAVDIRVADLLKDMGWKPTGDNYARIRTIISRLKATDVIIKNNATFGDLDGYKKKKTPTLNRGMSMIDGYLEFEKENGYPTRYLISIDKMLIFFFAGGLCTYLDWQQYKKLTPTGRRLTDYALSHKTPEPLSVEKFLLVCGSDTADMPAFRRNAAAKTACQELVKKGVVYDARVEDGYIVIEREKPKILEHKP